MKKLLTLLIIAFALQSCENKTQKNEKAEITSTNEIWKVKQDNFEIKIEILDSLQFYKEQKAIKHTTKPIEKITDFASAKKILNGVVEFWDGDEDGESHGLRRILFRNGATFTNKYSEDFFVAYYPSEDIILFEGGHSSDVSFNLKNGKQTEETGNPDYIVTSPDNQYRLNGFFDGQECVSYFIQKNINGHFENVIPLNSAFVRKDKINLCQANDFFWSDDNTLFFREVLYFDGEATTKSKYYKVSIIKAEAEQKSIQATRLFQSKNSSDFIPEGFVLYKDDIMKEIKGDLNKDGLEDIVLVIKGTNENQIVNDEHRSKLDRNRRGIIILLNKGNHYELALKNYDCFSSENEEGGVYYAPELIVEIKNGNLLVNYLHGRYGYWNYTFRHQNRDFELIGYDRSNNRGPMTESDISINFLTRKLVSRENTNENARDDGDEIFEETRKNIKIKEFIRLSEIRDFDDFEISEFYAEQ